MSRLDAKLYMAPATEADAKHFAPKLRQMDRVEVHASSGMRDYEKLLKLSIAVSHRAFAVRTLVGSDPVMIWGYSLPMLLSNKAPLWMLATDIFSDHYREIGRESKKFLTEKVQKPVVFHNYIDARNKAALRYVKFLGAKIFDAEPYGAFGLPFHRFELEMTDV